MSDRRGVMVKSMSVPSQRGGNCAAEEGVFRGSLVRRSFSEDVASKGKLWRVRRIGPGAVPTFAESNGRPRNARTKVTATLVIVIVSLQQLQAPDAAHQQNVHQGLDALHLKSAESPLD